MVQGLTSNRFDTSWRSCFLIDMALSGLGLGYFSGLCYKWRGADSRLWVEFSKVEQTCYRVWCKLLRVDIKVLTFSSLGICMQVRQLNESLCVEFWLTWTFLLFLCYLCEEFFKIWSTIEPFCWKSSVFARQSPWTNWEHWPRHIKHRWTLHLTQVLVVFVTFWTWKHKGWCGNWWSDLRPNT